MSVQTNTTVQCKKDVMSSRERWLATLRFQPVDRLVFWPKLNNSYARMQVEPYRSMTLDELHDIMGSDKHNGVGNVAEDKRLVTSLNQTEKNGIRTTTFHTPNGTMRQVDHFDPGSQSWHPVEFPVKTAEDIPAMIDWYRDANPSLNADAMERSRKIKRKLGDAGVTNCGVDESPLMRWIEWLAGVENGHVLLIEQTDRVEELFDVMHATTKRRVEINAEHSAADILYMVENTSTTLISPKQYKRYCLKYISEYGNIMRSHSKIAALHMCGHLKLLLKTLSTLPIDVFEAFTSPPVGDATLMDGRADCPNICLIGGSNAALWTRSVEEITAEAKQHLDVMPHHRGIAFTSAGVMPPLATPETIRAVRDWVIDYPVRND